MATLRLISIRCEGLADGSVDFIPLFLRTTVGGSSELASVTVTGATSANFQPDAVVSSFDIDGFIYLRTNDGAMFVSKDTIWNTGNAFKETSFDVMLDLTGDYSKLRPYVYYGLNTNIVVLLLNTIQNILFKLALFVQGLFTLLILNPLRLVFGQNIKNTKERFK